MTPLHKQILSAVAVVLTFVTYWPYIRSILQGRTRPHVFSWVIWGITTIIVFFAQLAGQGGIGAWPIGISGVITMVTAYLAYRHRADMAITTTDWGLLLAALSALPFWLLTADPLWAVVILTTVDLIGFGPTFRVAYVRPHHERMGFYALFILRNLLVILALERYSITTVLFPTAISLGCLTLVILMGIRRRYVALDPHRSIG
jgi:hypothetical protein